MLKGVGFKGQGFGEIMRALGETHGWTSTLMAAFLRFTVKTAPTATNENAAAQRPTAAAPTVEKRQEHAPTGKQGGGGGGGGGHLSPAVASGRDGQRAARQRDGCVAATVATNAWQVNIRVAYKSIKQTAPKLLPRWGVCLDRTEESGARRR